MELAESLLVESVPDVDETIGTTCCDWNAKQVIRHDRRRNKQISILTSRERVVDIVEGNGVHRMNVLDVVLLDAMALESELSLLHLSVQIKVLDGHATLNRAHHIALLVGEYANRSRLILERRFPSHQDLLHVSQIPDEHFSLGRRHHDLLVDHTHRVDSSVALLVRAHALLLACVPDLDGLVPAARYDAIHFGRVLHAFDGVRMGAENLFGLRVPVVVLERVVQTAAGCVNRTLWNVSRGL